jgi:hypothetical protein
VLRLDADGVVTGGQRLTHPGEQGYAKSRRSRSAVGGRRRSDTSRRTSAGWRAQNAPALDLSQRRRLVPATVLVRIMLLERSCLDFWRFWRSFR